MNNPLQLLVYFGYALFAIGILGIIFIVVNYLILKKPISDSRFTQLVDLGKWYLISAVLVVITSIIDTGFKERDQDVKEMQSFDKYVDNITEANGIEKRWLLSEYFAIVSPKGPLRDSWIEYKEVLRSAYEEYQRNKKRENELSLKDSLSHTEKIELHTVQEKNMIQEQSLLPANLPATEPFFVIAGGDKSLDAAKFELHKGITAGLSGVIYLKDNMYRTVIGPFPSRDEAQAQLPLIKQKINTGAYLVRSQAWCTQPVTRDGYLECK